MGTVEDAEAHVRWLGTIAGTYVRAAAADLRARGVSPKFRRERFLLAMPVFGTGCVKRSTADVGATAPVVLQSRLCAVGRFLQGWRCLREHNPAHAA